MLDGRRIAYLAEIDLQCSLIARAAARLDRESEAAERDELEIWTLVQTILTSSANLSLVLWGESPREREQRHSLRRFLEVGESSPLAGRQRELASERFDARVEEWEATRDRSFVTFVGRVISESANLEAASQGREWFEHFDPLTGVVRFWGHRVELGPILKEVHRIQPLAKTFDYVPR
jgi:hypothetical protein